MPRIYLYVFITLSKFKTYLMACLVNRFHKTVNKIFKSAVVIFRVILQDQLNILVRGGAVSLCCVLRQNTLLSQCLSPPRSLFKYIPVSYPAWKADDMLGSYLVTL